VNRRSFAQHLLGLFALSSTPWAFSGNTMNTHVLNAQALELLKQFPNTEPMPALFLGHGSPMYAITDTEFGRAIGALAGKMPKPHAILCISAHWETRGTWLTAMPNPRTIHDFGGFPQALFDVQYPAPGSPALAQATQQLIRSAPVGLDEDEWGLDHGTWSVIRHLYPNADIPVVQLSLDHFKSPQAHYDLAKELAILRRKGVLIVGSGNIVHNLRASRRGAAANEAYDWATEFDTVVQDQIKKGQPGALQDFQKLGAVAQQAHPTYEHYLPLLYAAGAVLPSEMPRFFNTGYQSASISMRSVLWG